MGNQPQRERGIPGRATISVIANWGTGGRMDYAPADQPSDAASTDEWPVRNAALGDPHAPDQPSDAASTDASSPTTPTDTPPTTATWPLLEKPALPPAATESRRKRRAAPAPDAVVVAEAVGRSEAVRKNVGEARVMALWCGVWCVLLAIGAISADVDTWAWVLVSAATIPVVVFVVRSVVWSERTRVEVHPHEIVTEAVSWWRRSPTRLAIGFDEITSVALDDEDGPKLLKVQTTLGRTLSGIPDGPGRAAALAIGQRLVAHGRARTIQNDDTRIHLGLGRSDWPTY
jgi:hypothetical protein